MGTLAKSMLNGIIDTAKQGATKDTKQGSMLRYQVALDASNAISRITECARNKPQSHPDDLLSAFQVSPLVSSDNPQKMPSSPGHHDPIEHCALFLYNHARLILTHRTDLAAKAVAPTTYSPGALSSSKLIQPRNALRMPSAFSHSIIETYQKVPNLPLIIPARTSRDSSWETVPLTGSSDPVAFILSHGIRRVRKNDSREDSVVVVTMRLYNITPVPIRNGVRLSLKVAQEIASDINETYDDGSTCMATSVYRHEIGAGDFITWEIVLGNWRGSSLSLQPSVTFRDLEQESSTRSHKWLSGRGMQDDPALPSEAIDEDDELMLDVTLPCRPITLSPISSLQPCPLVFFSGFSRCESNLGCGDAVSFQLLWDYMGGCERKLAFTMLNFEMEGATVKNLIDTKRGYVALSPSTIEGVSESCNSVTGCAFMAPNGSRIFCIQKMTGELSVRSDLPNLLDSLVGTPLSQASFLRFVFGEKAVRLDDSSQRAHVSSEASGHDFPSVTMRSNSHDFPSMTMSHTDENLHHILAS